MNLREKRDSFLTDLKETTNSPDLIQKIDNLKKLCVCAEKIYDVIKSNLSDLPISKKTPEIQCWAVIRRAQGEIDFLKTETRKYLESIDGKQKVFDISTAHLINESGESYSPDVVISKTVDYVSLSLKMIGFNYKLNSGGFIVIPDMVDVEEDDIIDAGKIFYNSILWSSLERSVETCLLFDYELNEYNSTNLPNGLENSGLETFYEFNLTKEQFIRLDYISNERLYSKLSQNFMEALYKHNVHKTVDENLTSLTNINNGYSITTSEFPSYVALLETLCLSDGNMLILGLTLREWVRCYSALERLSKISKQREVFTFSALSAYLQLVGISSDKSRLFIDFASFNNESRDLYDSPLLKMKSGDYLFCSIGYFSPGISNIILSKFSSLKVDLSQKGFGFEKEIHEMLSHLKMNYQHFKFKRENEEYEYDAIILLDDKVFVLECKNTNLSGGSVSQAFKKQTFLIDAANQVIRLADGLKKHKDVFSDKFGLDINNFEIIPVIVNNLPFSLPGKYCGVYVTDYSALSKILHNSHISGIEVRNEYGMLTSTNHPMHKLWENNALQASDLIKQFESPIQLNEFFESTAVKKHTLQINDSVAFGIECLEGDIGQLVEYRRERMNECLTSVTI
ncbi:NERD domain-containing protein [Klebsiella pneumoniae]|uniref:NERD domain-containing protein n=1 Tax=Klebsiella pneumoniae TaxID=573 RepID=UPI001FAE3098|nr:NERD domain-containing protein [Klebsiella pneumoniae]MCI7969204.1 NERD domain-containing protein [Klebsiella pneumoniae]MCI8119703.1 NERD domain-containing protein [Klebsiella pneumoniae]HCF8301528.1 NERD domain-containing protein [Klebsiella pneumoniae]